MTRRRTAMPWLQTAAALLALGCAACLRAQDGPVVVGQAPETHGLWLDPPRTTLELLYRHQADNTENSRDSSAADIPHREDRFEETLQLSTTGYIYHPNLVDLHLSGTFGLTQAWLDDDGAAEYESGILREWDVSSSFLRKEPVGLTLYSRQRRGLLDREFGPSVDTTVTTSGGILDIRSELLPTQLEYSRAAENQAAVSDTPGYDFTQDTFTWHTDCRPTDRQQLFWNYTQIWKEESPDADNQIAFNTRDLSLTHAYQFGDDERYRLDSSFRDFRQTGDWDRQQRHWDETLNLQHTDWFSSRARYAFEQNSFSSQDETQNSGEIGFTHRLYESVITNGTTGIRDRRRDDGGDSVEKYATLSPEYHKKIPFGLLTVNLGVGLDKEDIETRSSPTQVANVEATFSDEGPITLVGAHIIPSSVVVSDTTGLIVFIVDYDYTQTVFPDHVELKRIVGGRILNGQRVRIDYRLDPAPATTTTTRTESAGVRYELQEWYLKGLGVYARYANQDQTVDTDYLEATPPNTYDDTTFGSDYRIGGLSTGIERRHHDSSIAPFDADRVFARYAHRLDGETTLHFTSAYSITDYPQSANEVDLLTLGTSIQHRFTERLTASARLLWRDEDDRLQGNSRGFEQELQLQWSIRQTSINLLVRNATLDTTNENRSHQLVRFGLRREF